MPKAKAKAEEVETEKTEVVETTDGEKQVVETETEVKPAEEQPAAECEPKAEEPAVESAPELSEIVGSLTARVEELEKQLAASQAAQAKAEASLAALSGGLRGPATAAAPKAPAPATWNEALAAYRAEHADMDADDAFVACARLHRDLWQSSIKPYKK